MPIPKPTTWALRCFSWSKVSRRSDDAAHACAAGKVHAVRWSRHTGLLLHAVCGHLGKALRIHQEEDEKEAQVELHLHGLLLPSRGRGGLCAWGVSVGFHGYSLTERGQQRSLGFPYRASTR